MKKTFKKILDWMLFIVSGSGPIAKEAEDEGLCDFSGQGRG